MTAPIYSTLGQRLQERTEPMQPEDVDAANGYAHGHLSEAMMQPFGQVGELIDPPDPYEPWAPLFKPDLCPDWALTWLGQAVGVRIPETATADQARSMITGLSFEDIGKTSAILAALLLTLTGANPTVYFRERDEGDPYALEIVTRTSETPDPAKSLRALQSQVPAGIKLTFTQVAGWDYQAQTTAGGLYSAQTALGQTYGRQSEGP